MNSLAAVTGIVVLFLGLSMFNLRALPANPATVAEIEADGGKWVRTVDGRLIEYHTCGRPGC